ncbi:1228_t:CDS:1, partial [Paraglomus brasilianum]
MVDKLPVEVDVVEGEKRDDKFVASLPKIPNIQGFNQGAVLITCYITQQQTGSRSQVGSGNCIVFTMHLHKPDNTKPTEVCIS